MSKAVSTTNTTTNKKSKGITKATTKKKSDDKTGSSKVKNTIKRIKELSPIVTTTTNNEEWGKFLDYIQKRMLTFDVNSDKYIDYHQRKIDRDQPVKKYVVK